MFSSKYIFYRPHKVDDFRAQYEALAVAYPQDAANKSAVASAADVAIKAAAAEVSAEVAAKCAGRL